MPIVLNRPDLFPDDTNPLPTPASAEQKLLIEDEHEIGTESYLERLQALSDVTDDIYPELIGNCLNVLHAVQVPRPLRVLDLCSGIGLVSLKLIERDVAIEELTLVDLSPTLLERATAVLRKSPHIDKVKELKTAEADLLIDDLSGWKPESYDLVLTCNGFQHFPRQRQRELFASIQRLLVPNGVFMFASQFKPLRQKWKEFVIKDVQDNLAKHGAPPAVISNAGHHIAHYHHHLNVLDVYNWLESARFGFFDCVFRRFIIAIFAAVK